MDNPVLETSGFRTLDAFSKGFRAGEVAARSFLEGLPATLAARARHSLGEGPLRADAREVANGIFGPAGPLPFAVSDKADAFTRMVAALAYTEFPDDPSGADPADDAWRGGFRLSLDMALWTDKRSLSPTREAETALHEAAYAVGAVIAEGTDIPSQVLARSTLAPYLPEGSRGEGVRRSMKKGALSGLQADVMANAEAAG